MMTTRKLVLTGLFVAIGIVLPQTTHLIGGPSLGSILLPMHLPVFIGAMLLGPLSGLLIAIVSVVVGVSIGMPSMLIASYMIFELAVYGLISGYLYHNKKVNVYVSFFIAKLAGMLTAILIIQVLLNLIGLSFPPVFGTLGMFVIGLPGVAIQIVLVPLTVKLIEKSRRVYE